MQQKSRMKHEIKMHIPMNVTTSTTEDMLDASSGTVPEWKLMDCWYPAVVTSLIKFKWKNTKQNNALS